MVWHIKKTSMFGSGVGTVYYKGDNRWTETFADRATYTSQAKAKAEDETLEKSEFAREFFAFTFTFAL